MSKVTSREYKLMLDHRMFAARKTAVRAFWKDVQHLAGRCGIESCGTLNKVDKRTIQFLDTADLTFHRNRLIFRSRQRQGDDAIAELSLKCRTEDRYVANGKDLRQGEGLEGKRKFEEDIAAPFRSRFSRSTTVASATAGPPETLTEAARLFPILGRVRRDGSTCDGSTSLVLVNGFTAHERVVKGPTLRLAADCEATVAVILWSHAWKGRVVAAEMSFRYGDEKERYLPEAAETAFELFTALQSLDWCVPGGPTKTQFAYGGA